MACVFIFNALFSPSFVYGIIESQGWEGLQIHLVQSFHSAGGKLRLNSGLSQNLVREVHRDKIEEELLGCSEKHYMV